MDSHSILDSLKKRSSFVLLQETDRRAYLQYLRGPWLGKGLFLLGIILGGVGGSTVDVPVRERACVSPSIYITCATMQLFVSIVSYKQGTLCITCCLCRALYSPLRGGTINLSLHARERCIHPSRQPRHKQNEAPAVRPSTSSCLRTGTTIRSTTFTPHLFTATEQHVWSGHWAGMLACFGHVNPCAVMNVN